MMRGGVTISLAFALASCPGTVVEASEIPAHPTELRFPERTLVVPSSEGVEHLLATGTRVVIVPDTTVPLVQVVVALRAGRFLDPPDKPGVAELTGALVRRGGSTLHSPDEIDQALDFLGADMNTRSGDTRSGASMECLVETLYDCLEIFFEFLAQPGFDAERLESARSSMIASLEARNDDPMDVLSREWAWLLGGRSHFASRQLTADELGAVTQDDLFEFHQRYWDPRQAVIAVSGDVYPEEILELLEMYTVRWATAVETPKAVPWPPPPSNSPVEPGLFLAPHAAAQAKVSLGHPLPRSPKWESREAMALEIANEILGGTAGVISRINGRLRGREGLVYRALSEVDTHPDTPGSFRIFFDAIPQNVARAIEVCVEEIERIRSTPVHPRELEIVQQEFLSRLQLRFDSGESTAGYFAEDLLIGRPHGYWRTMEKRIRSITLDDVQRAARRFLRPEDLIVLVAGGGVRELAVEEDASRRTRKLLENATVLPVLDPLSLEPLTAAGGEANRAPDRGSR